MYGFLADASTPSMADRYTSEIIAFCESLSEFPRRGLSRDDIRPGLRTIPWRRRVVIAFVTGGNTVDVIGVFYGGRDYEGLLTEA